MKQMKALTKEQKECVAGHYLSTREWRILRETEFYYVLKNTRDGRTRWIDKFRRVDARRWKGAF